jgi:hypothetical protein
MLPTNANPFRNYKAQPWLVLPPDAGKPAAPPATSQTAFVLPKTEAPKPQVAPPNPQVVAPHPALLLSSGVGFGNIAGYLMSIKAGTNPANATKTGGTSFVENTGWDEEYDPETGASGEPSLRRRIPAFMHDGENSFNQSLNLLY